MKPILITLMVCLFGGLNAFGQVDTSRNDGYLSVISYDDGFVAAGTGGRVDWFSTDGVFIQNKQIPNLDIHDLLFLNGTLYVAGNQGALFYSNDGRFFKKIDTKLTSTIHALIEFQGQIIAGTNQGLILVGDEHQEFSPVQLPLLGNVVALSANKTWCYGVTDQGEIFHSKDGKDWKVLNFNREYHGYYQPCQFNGVLVTDNSIAVIGKHEDNTPALFFSSEGNVWTERMLTYVNDNGQSVLLKELPVISYMMRIWVNFCWAVPEVNSWSFLPARIAINCTMFRLKTFIPLPEMPAFWSLLVAVFSWKRIRIFSDEVWLW